MLDWTPVIPTSSSSLFSRACAVAFLGDPADQTLVCPWYGTSSYGHFFAEARLLFESSGRLFILGHNVCFSIHSGVL